jgi:hypothetical protein
MTKGKRKKRSIKYYTECVVLYRSFFPFSFGHNIVCPSMICMVYVAQSLVFCVVLYRSFFPFSFNIMTKGKRKKRSIKYYTEN